MNWVSTWATTTTANSAPNIRYVSHNGTIYTTEPAYEWVDYDAYTNYKAWSLGVTRKVLNKCTKTI